MEKKKSKVFEKPAVIIQDKNVLALMKTKEIADFIANFCLLKKQIIEGKVQLTNLSENKLFWKCWELAERVYYILYGQSQRTFNIKREKIDKMTEIIEKYRHIYKEENKDKVNFDDLNELVLIYSDLAYLFGYFSDKTYGALMEQEEPEYF